VGLSLTALPLDEACSNLLVAPGASVDSSTIIAYNADSAELFGTLYHYPRGSHDPSAMRNVWDWDSGEYKGQIKEALETFNVVGKNTYDPSSCYHN
jgi:hypothetical protein